MVNILKDNPRQEDINAITKLKGELLMKEKLYNSEIKKLRKAKDKLLDEQEESAIANMKTTKDLVAQFQGM